MRGRIFAGVYINVDFSDCNLTGALLLGEFIGCRFNATFYKAERRGTFVHCEVVG